MLLLYIAVPSLVTSELKNATIVRGQQLCISFEYLANPVVNFTWYINDNLYVDAESIPQLYDDYHKMVFVNATEEGWYRCIMQNELGTAEYAVFVDILRNSQDATVSSVLFVVFFTCVVPPQITSVNNETAALGTTVILRCESSGDKYLQINIYITNI